MIKDPYTVLGVTRDATDDEIKKAYRALARKYHPDNYADSNLADLAEEKMKEINEAYDAVQKMRAGASGESFQEGAEYEDSDFSVIRQMIRQGQFSDAELILDGMPQNRRGAEWNYLKGIILIERGYYFDAQKYIETACYLDPMNAEYRSTKQRMRAGASSYGSGYRTTPYANNCDLCDICSALLWADCLCECCGGDLIRCC